MPLIDAILIDGILFLFQLKILWDVCRSDVWRCDRCELEAVKAHFVNIAIACLLTIGFIVAVTLFGLLGDSPTALHWVLSVLFIGYSLVSHQAVVIYKRRRIEKGKNYAVARPKFSSSP